MRLTGHNEAKVAVLISFCAVIAFAQPQPPPPQQNSQEDVDPDSPNHGAARISVMNGDVSVRRGDNGDFVAAVVNAPLVVGDRVLTGPNGRAEVQFDSANMIRVAPNSEIRLSELAYRRYQVQLARGMATFRVLRASNAEVEVSTPQASIRPKREGVFRLAVGEDGQSEATVRAGEVEVFTPRGAETLYAGKTMQMRGTVSEPEFQVVAANGEDEWDGWNRDRDRVLMSSRSPRYVNPDVYGTEDLDAYGRWVPDPSYGNVWAPQVPAGWAPYQAGRWVWVDYYGWTWVSYDPWGWAPYHYGRWFRSPVFGWCWYPGGFGFGVRSYWSPALVGFVGFGGGVGFGFGGIGWIPLAPFERFHPWYGRGFYGGGFRGATIVNNVNIYNTYRNARVANGVTTVDRAGFASGAAGRPFTGNLSQASVVRGQLPVTPNRASMQPSNRPVSQAAISRASNNTQFFSSRQSGQPNRASFGQANAGSQNAQGGWRQFGQPATNGSSQSQARTASQAVQSSSASRGSWGRFGDPAARPAQATQNRVAPQSNGGGWQKFNSSSAATNNTNVSRSTPQSVRISPPMVRERSAPAPRSSSGGGSHNSGGGSHRR